MLEQFHGCLLYQHAFENGLMKKRTIVWVFSIQNLAGSVPSVKG
jgi:hypothetical protein